jgi:hypothetical protein
MLQESRSLKNTKDAPCLRTFGYHGLQHKSSGATTEPGLWRFPPNEQWTSTTRTRFMRCLLLYHDSQQLTTITLSYEHDFYERRVRSEP